MPVLKPLHVDAQITRLIASTYQAVSGAGVAGIAELEAQVNGAAVDSVALARGGDALKLPAPKKFAAPIAFNVLPFAGAYFGDEGWTDEELKFQNETRKILEIPDLPVSGTCVRVPVYTVIPCPSMRSSQGRSRRSAQLHCCGQHPGSLWLMFLHR